MTTSRPLKLSIFWWLLPSLCAIVVWSGSLQNGFVWDDRTLIVENSKLSRNGAVLRAFFEDFWSTQLEEGKTNYYRPLVTISYIVDRAVYGLYPWGYHFTNLIIHALNCLLLLLLLTRLGTPRNIALIASCLCAVHPAFGETVAWVSGRTDSLALFWILMTILASLYERRSLSMVSFVCALCSKELAIVTPLVVYLIAKASGNKKPLTIAAAPHYLVPLVGWFCLRSAVLHGDSVWRGSSGVSIVNGLTFLLHVVGNVVYPPTFRIEYGARLQIHDVLAGAAWGSLALGFLMWGSLQSPPIRNKKESKIRKDPHLISPLCCGALALLIPSALAVLLKSVIGARLVYGSAFFMVPALVISLQKRCSASILTLGGVVLGVVLGGQAVERARLWRSDISLFERALQSPNPSTRVHLNLGIALYDAGRLYEAKAQLEHQMEAAAQDQQEYMLGLLYTLIGCERAAEQHYKGALRRNSANLSSITNLIGLYATQGRVEEIARLRDEISRQFPSQRPFVNTLEERAKRSIRAPERIPMDKQWCESAPKIDEFLQSPPALTARGSELAVQGQSDMAKILFRAAELSK